MAKEIAASVRRWQEGCPSLQHVLLSTDKGSEAITGEPCLIESTENLRFQVSANSFFQVNPVVSSRMLAFVRSLLPERVESLLDIYAGVGFFSFGLSQAAREVFAVESGASAITDFETNRELNQIEHVRMLPGLAEKVLPGLERNFETALLDPPRAGCPAPVLEWLSGHVQRQIIYISCDPTTLARDLQKLAQQGWRIDCVQPFDMFPQTYHIETVVSLSRA